MITMSRCNPSLPKRGSSSAQIYGPQRPPSVPKTKEPLTDGLKAKNEGKVKRVELFNSVELEKNYGPYSMTFDGKKIRKHVPGTKEQPAASEEEIKRFIRDVTDAARNDRAIAGFVIDHPLPKPI